MNKTQIDKNIHILKYIGRKASEENKSKVENIIELYSKREIPTFSQAATVLELLVSTRKSKATQDKTDKKYRELMHKYNGAASQTGKLARPTTIITKIVPKNVEKALSRISFALDTDVKVFRHVFAMIEKPVKAEIQKMYELKKSMKLQFLISFTIMDTITKLESTPMWSTKFMEIVGNNINIVIESLSKELELKLEKLQDIKGSSWTIKEFHYLDIGCATTKAVRGASYIPTPEPYNNAKCGLINIKNDDEKCFYWCTKYHHTSKDKNSDRVSVLRKTQDKYS